MLRVFKRFKKKALVDAEPQQERKWKVFGINHNGIPQEQYVVAATEKEAEIMAMKSGCIYYTNLGMDCRSNFKRIYYVIAVSR